MNRSLLLLVAMLLGIMASAAEIQLLQPLGRTSYQTNEIIEISVVRSDAQPLPAGLLTLTLLSNDASKLTFTFPVKAANMRATEHLRLNGWLLRPGTYDIQAACDGATATTSLTIYSHVRKSNYKTIHWGGSRNNMMTIEGENGMGFNLAWGEYGEPSIGSGQDVMGNCLMGGGHQHDLRLTNDWSDPNVYIGAIQRGVDRAFSFRTMPNAIGAHLHDEPGLTWLPNPKTGKQGPHDISFQRDAYLRAFGEEAIYMVDVDTKDPVKLAQWEKINDFKLGFMDAFWKASEQVLSKFKPGYLAVTQSQYGWSALYDGYYFNVVRSMPVVSGHGGYNDFWLRNFNASMFLEMALPRQLDKPTWYLPTWYGMTSDALREEHNLSFITGIQGMATPPGLNINSEAAQGIVATNKLYSRLGSIFEKPAQTHHPLAMLYSKSNNYYNMGHTQLDSFVYFYMASKMTQYPMNVVLDEDVIDGSLAADHKAVIVSAVTYLDPAVLAGLEAFAAAGGVVITTTDTTVAIKGETKLQLVPGDAARKETARITALTDADAKKAASLKAYSFRAQMENAEPVAKALGAVLKAKNIQPAFVSDIPTIAPGKQVRGEIEYIFAVNYTPEAGYSPVAGGYGVPIPAQASISLPDDGRPIYDAINSGNAPFAKKGQLMTASYNFGPGQMVALARTARPIGGMQLSTVNINRDLTRTEDIQRIEFNATLVDGKQQIISGAAPLQITVTDALGMVRYNIYRATDQGVCRVSLPLAANDPAGQWTVSARELLTGTEAKVNFTYQPATQCGAVAGTVPRAIYYEPDKANVYQFFRQYRQVLVVAGAGQEAAAQRVVDIFKPYNINATILPMEEAIKPRPLTDEEAKTWCGTSLAGSLDANTRKNAAAVGYNLSAPAILIGNPQDNPLIKRLADAKVLPYPLNANFPGPARGMVAWNVMTLGHDVEVIACIGNDEAGVAEAIGTLFTMGVGLDPLTPLNMPQSNSITPAKTAVPTPLPLQAAWSLSLSDRAVAMAVNAQGVTNAYCINGQQYDIDAQGKVLKAAAFKLMPEIAKATAVTTDLPKDKLNGSYKLRQVLKSDAGYSAVAFYGGHLQIFAADGTLVAEEQFSQDITALCWNGKSLLVAQADGKLQSFLLK